MSDLYAKAGVNIQKGNEVVEKIKNHVKSTHTSAVLVGIGSFGGLYDLGEILKSYEHPVLVQSIDGVGTKLAIARMMGKYYSVGEDIVGHSCGDIVAMGARPITFLDYVANETLDVGVMEEIVSGMAHACKEAGVALIGGETAEMPGIYMKGEHDIAGCITGIVEKGKIITGENIAEGDVVLGLPSHGLNTNGFSLARKIFFDVAKVDVHDVVPELGMSAGEALLKVHSNYAPAVLNLIDNNIKLNGIAHITGGGFIDNIPRVLPSSLDAEIKIGSWPEVPIFPFMQKIGNIREGDMYRTFNMGIGMVLITDKNSSEKIKNMLGEKEVFEIGKIIKGSRKVILK